MNQAQSKVGLIVAGLLLSILLASMDNTIVATAMGTIIGEMGGFDKFVWVTSAYMVAEMAGMPIFGKLSDMYGRKRFFIFGIIVFMGGSALCGMAESIIQLSLFRAIQGIGAGAMVSIAFTIMFDVIAPKDRGKMTGMFGATFGLSSVFAPMLGGFITDKLHWSWIFYINLPLGLLSFLLIVFYYKPSKQYVRQKIDLLGAGLLVGAIVCLMFGLELGGKEYAWGSPQILGLFCGFILLGLLLVYVEKRAVEPIISFRMFRSRLYTTSNLIALLSGGAFMTASVYIPIFIQGVLGGTATNSGFVLLPMMMGSVVTATLGGMLMNKLPYRAILLPTLVILCAGIGLLGTLTPDSPRWLITLYMILIGLGMGASFSVLSGSALHSFSAAQRGAATSTLNFNRSLGMVLGITVFSLIQNHALTSKLAAVFSAVSNGGVVGAQLDDTNSLLDPAVRAAMDENTLGLITGGLSSSIAATFQWALIPAILALVSAFMMSREKLDPEAEAAKESYAAAH